MIQAKAILFYVTLRLVCFLLQAKVEIREKEGPAGIPDGNNEMKGKLGEVK